ncbi:50S ribosomal protein L11 methyltransferase [Sphingomonas psychrotolerans]|uniref:50S ribosomal protein L11 methyltransferase n=1 Tax=Sphingomonas psychrotolerans TaxID=1327635 RepID=A0ABU3N2A2_9SPHN|nr:50S ribosomal protein L11 methyltransferase [Sphingomonas psychrotolerans]MDT8758667.1 50S ribosomal protein L11 methyltransferase [Sphingomonas psychrotolerans]
MTDPASSDSLTEARAVLAEAMALHEQGDLAAAEAGYRAVLAQGYRPVDVLPLLAGLLGRLSRPGDALAAWDQLLAIDPDHAVALHEKGLTLHWLGRTAEAVAALERASALDPDNPVAIGNLAVVLADAGRNLEALGQFRRALALQPDNLHLRHQVRRLGSGSVPFWHIPMMNDVARNDAFEAAIKAALAVAGPEARVLDIGAGSGLLSLMAARAGAQKVVACEMEPMIAEMAQQIVARNGYADRIAVHARPSTALAIGAELDAPADILVSEILSSDLLTEKVLDTFEDAHRRLLAPDALVIPRAASAMGCLVASDNLADYAFVGEVSGFDLSPFTAFAPQRLPIHGTMTGWQRLSDDVELVRLDLTRKKHDATLARLRIPVTASGRAIGIVQWMHIDLWEGVTFDNHPDRYTDGGWLQVLHSFPEPIEVAAGETLDIAVGHDRITLILLPLGA